MFANFELEDWSIACDWLEDNPDQQDQFIAWFIEKCEIIFEKVDCSLLKRISIPLVRRIYPQLIAEKIVNVQPLSGPTGLVYYLRHRYSATSSHNSSEEPIGKFILTHNKRYTVSAIIFQCKKRAKRIKNKNKTDLLDNLIIILDKMLIRFGGVFYFKY